jgi:hypothetical protein
MLMITKQEELKDRVEARRLALQAKLHELKADARAEAAQARDKITKGLDDLAQTLEEGWDDLSDAARDKLNRWLDRN